MHFYKNTDHRIQQGHLKVIYSRLNNNTKRGTMGVLNYLIEKDGKIKFCN